MRINRQILFSLLSAFLLLLAAMPAWCSSSVTLQLSPANPGVGDMAYLKITCINVKENPSAPASVPGFQVKYFAMTQMRSRSVYNGSSNYSVQQTDYTVTLRADKEGKYTFGPITVGGVKSNTISYTIGPASKKSAPSQSTTPSNPFAATHAPTLVKSGGNDLFLIGELSNPTPYEQQPVVYTIKLYTSYEGTQPLAAPSGPSFENCISEELNDVDHEYKQESYKGKLYNTAVLKRYLLFPTRPGKATIKGNSFSFSVKQLMEYDDGSGNYIPIYQRAQVDATASDAIMEVKPLPVPDNGDHICGVGSFTVRTEVPKSKVAANQIVNIKYIIAGSGNLNYVSLPDIESQLPQEIKLVKTESKIDSKYTSDNMTGTVEFTVSLMPEKEGTFEIPQFTFLFFNPVNGTLYHQKAQGVTLNVGASEHSSEGSGKLTWEPKLQKDNRMTKAPRFIIDRFGYYLCFIVPVVLLVMLMLLYRRYMKISTDVVGLKRRRAGRVARMRLRKSAQFMRRNRTQEFFAETLKATWGYLSHKLNLPASELSRDNISDKLLERGYPTETVTDLINLLDECEMARYASAAQVSMKKVYDEAVQVIDRLEEFGDKKSEAPKSNNLNNVTP